MLSGADPRGTFVGCEDGRWSMTAGFGGDVVDQFAAPGAFGWQHEAELRELSARYGGRQVAAYW